MANFITNLLQIYLDIMKYYDNILLMVPFGLIAVGALFSFVFKLAHQV